MNTPEEQWTRLASAARRSAERRPESAPAPDREEIGRRLGALRGTLREMFLALLWRRWALIAVVIGIIAYVAVYLLLTSDPGGSPDRPKIPLPFPP